MDDLQNVSSNVLNDLEEMNHDISSGFKNVNDGIELANSFLKRQLDHLD